MASAAPQSDSVSRVSEAISAHGTEDYDDNAEDGKLSSVFSLIAFFF